MGFLVIKDNAMLEIVDCENTLRPTIQLLQIISNESSLDESNILDALGAIQVMPIIQSPVLAKQIIEIVFNASILRDINPNVIDLFEKIMLQLMAVDMEIIKR